MRIICVLGSIVYAFVTIFTGKFLKMTTPEPSSIQPKTFTHDTAWYERACYAGNATYRGVQEVEGEDEGEDRSKDLVLFNAQSGSTLALEAGRFTVKNVYYRVQRHMNEWTEHARRV